VIEPAAPLTSVDGSGWDCHVHVFDASAPVRPAHYIPAHRPLSEIEQLAHRHGIGHLVLVQPSVYGTDNSVMLQALEAAPARHRGIAVVDPNIADDDLDRMHAAGVRGVRFNLVSPAGHSGDVKSELLRIAPRLRARGWHVQWYVLAEDLPQLVAWQAQTGLCFVLDHLAGLDAGLTDTHPAWAAAEALACGGAWIKLSGWYRLGSSAPYPELWPKIRRVARLFGPHTVWGSDWPHTSFAANQMPAYESTLAPVRECLEATRFSSLLFRHAADLYR
jgi:predicted TIM-barrel fold metal-dependent hydrolase